MFCAVCNTFHNENKSCPECGFKNNHEEFVDESEKTYWETDIVLPYRMQYWQQLTEFEFEGTTLKKYKKKGDVTHGLLSTVPSAGWGRAQEPVHHNNTSRTKHMPTQDSYQAS